MQFFDNFHHYIQTMRTNRQKLAAVNFLERLPRELQKDIGWKTHDSLEAPSLTKTPMRKTKDKQGFALVKTAGR